MSRRYKLRSGGEVIVTVGGRLLVLSALSGTSGESQKAYLDDEGSKVIKQRDVEFQTAAEDSVLFVSVIVDEMKTKSYE